MKKVIVVGAGEIGKNLTLVLCKQNIKVVLVEKNENLAKELAMSVDALIINGDGTDILTLEDAEAENADAIVAATNDDKANLMICEIAKSLNVPIVVARVNKPGNEGLFLKLGISSIIPVTANAVTAMQTALSDAGERIVGEIGNGKAQIVELVVKENSRAVGFSGSKLGGGRVGAIYRNGAVIIPDKKTEFQAGDVITVIARTEHIPKIQKLVKGD